MEVPGWTRLLPLGGEGPAEVKFDRQELEVDRCLPRPARAEPGVEPHCPTDAGFGPGPGGIRSLGGYHPESGRPRTAVNFTWSFWLRPPAFWAMNTGGCAGLEVEETILVPRGKRDELLGLENYHHPGGRYGDLCHRRPGGRRFGTAGRRAPNSLKPTTRASRSKGSATRSSTHAKMPSYRMCLWPVGRAKHAPVW